MTLNLASGFFLGPNTDANGDVIPYDWNTTGNWFVNGASSTGLPGVGDVAQIGLLSSGAGYEVGVSGGEHVATGELLFSVSSVSAPAAYSQDLVLAVTGTGTAGSASITLGGVNGIAIGGDRFNDGYVAISQGGLLEVDSSAAGSVSVFFGTYSNPYDGGPSSVAQQGSNNNLLTIGAPGLTGFDYLHTGSRRRSMA